MAAKHSLLPVVIGKDRFGPQDVVNLLKVRKLFLRISGFSVKLEVHLIRVCKGEGRMFVDPNRVVLDFPSFGVTQFNYSALIHAPFYFY